MNSEKINRAHYNLMLYLSRLFCLPLVKPKVINLCINRICNLNCIMCDQKLVEDETFISLNQAKKVLNEMAEWGIGFVDITGGEPFLHPDIFEMINYAAQKGILTEVDTNAFFPVETAEKVLASSLDRICISLETHDMIRGKKGTFEKVVNFIDTINRHRSKAEDKPLIIIACTVMNQNLDELVEIVEFVRRKKLSGVFFHPVTSGLYQLTARVGFKMPEDNSCWIPPERYPILNKIIDKFIDIRRESPWPIHNPLAYLEEMKNYFQMQYSHRKNNCFAGYKCLHIVPNAHVGSCGHAFGNLDRPLWKSWHSVKAIISRHAISRCRRPCMIGDHTDTEARSLMKIIRNLLF